jgi:predicted ATPase
LAGGHLPAGVSLADLGVHRLRDLSEPLRVFQLLDDGLPSHFPPLLSMDAFPGNLPLQVSSFIGREVELARVAKALGESRVVTLTGVGGVGKTRLALRAAAEELPRYREGAWLVELQAVRDPEAVARAVAAVFRLADRAGMSTLEVLVDFMQSKQLLLVLDNCEHLLDPVAELVDALERACPGAVVLATSREGLALEGERVVPVPALSAPATGADVNAVADCEAVRLFVERAAWVDPDFALTERNAAAVGQVCRRLDGLPLGVELAAARIGAMTPVELARGLDHRFDTLAGGRRRAVQRHQTLRAAIDWSYQLCSEAERRLLARLAVFAGGCSREAAEAVCDGDPLAPGEMFEVLAGLVAKSLVVAQREGPATRYRLLETIREYGEDRLAEYGETGQLRRVHAEYYCQIASVLVERLSGPEELDAHRLLVAERDNLLAALNYAIDIRNVDLALRLVRHSPPPGIQLGFAIYLPIATILDLPGARSHDLYPYALATSAIGAAAGGQLGDVERKCQEALRAARRLTSEQERCQVELAVTIARTARLLALGHWREAAGGDEHVAGIAGELGMEAVAASYLSTAAFAYAVAGYPQGAVDIANEALDRARAAGSPTVIALCLVTSAGAVAGSDPPVARRLLEEALALRETLDIETIAGVTQAALIAAGMGDWLLTLQLADRAIRHLQWGLQRPYLAGVLNVVARALAPTDTEAAARLQGAARHLVPQPVTEAATATPGRTDPAEPAVAPSGSSFITDLRRQTSELLHDALDEARLRQLRSEGEAMDSDQAAAYALEAIRRGRQSTAH